MWFWLILFLFAWGIIYWKQALMLAFVMMCIYIPAQLLLPVFGTMSIGVVSFAIFGLWVIGMILALVDSAKKHEENNEQ